MAQALGREPGGGTQQGSAGGGVKVAELDHRFWGTFGSVVGPIGPVKPQLGDHQQITLQRVLPRQGPVGMQALAVLQRIVARPRLSTATGQQQQSGGLVPWRSSSLQAT